MQGSVHNSFPSSHRESEANHSTPALSLQSFAPAAAAAAASAPVHFLPVRGKCHSLTPNFHVMHNKMFKCHLSTVEPRMNCLKYTVYVVFLFFPLRGAAVC